LEASFFPVNAGLAKGDLSEIEKVTIGSGIELQKLSVESLRISTLQQGVK